MVSRVNPQLWMLSLALVLVGCATPQIRTSVSGMDVQVTSKAPAVTSVKYSRDGTAVISGAFDDSARLWDLRNVRQARRFKGHTSVVDGVAFSPDGKIIATASIGGMTNFSGNVTTLWDATTGAELKEIQGIGGKISFSPDGKYIMGNTGGFSAGTTKLVDVQTGSTVREYRAGSGQISPNGKYIAILQGGGNKGGLLTAQWSVNVDLLDFATGQQIWRAEVGSVGALAFSPDGKYLLVAQNMKQNLVADLHVSYVLLDARTGARIKEFGHSTHTSGFMNVSDVYYQVAALAFSPNSQYFLSGDLGGRYKLWDIATGTVVRQMKLVDEIAGTMLNIAPSVAFSPDGRTAVVASLASVRLFDVSTGDELATLIGFEDGEWLITTPSGYYNASEKGDQYLSVTIGGKPYTVAQLRESFFRPDLVRVAFSGGSLREHRQVADIRPPPAIAIVDTPASVDSDQVTVALRLADQGGGIGDVRLYLNGTAVVLENTRNLAVAARPDAGKRLSYKLRLVPGKNTVRAIVFNADNSMQSTDALHEIEAKVAARRPSLHALVIGIQEYENPKLTLKYPVSDARLVASTLRARAAGLFERVEVTELTTRAATRKDSLLKTMQELQAKVRPDDLFVFYVASHGTVDEGRYYLITSNVGSVSTEALKRDAVSQDDLKALIANVPATKKLVVIDTCNAGKLGEAIQVAMLTRGMNEETAIKILSRAVGSTILSASSSVQEALEGYQGHGLFTYVVAEGLKGQADLNRDGAVNTLELATYVDDRVPALAERVFKHKQYPLVSPSGQGFPVTRAGAR